MEDLGEVKNYQKVKEDKEYPWPCKDRPNRTLKIFSDDVLHRTNPGVFSKVTGIGCSNILIPEEDIIEAKGNGRHLFLM